MKLIMFFDPTPPISFGDLVVHEIFPDIVKYLVIAVLPSKPKWGNDIFLLLNVHSNDLTSIGPVALNTHLFLSLFPVVPCLMQLRGALEYPH